MTLCPECYGKMHYQQVTKKYVCNECQLSLSPKDVAMMNTEPLKSINDAVHRAEMKYIINIEEWILLKEREETGILSFIEKKKLETLEHETVELYCETMRLLGEWCKTYEKLFPEET